jgi:hypothetical protein
LYLSHSFKVEGTDVSNSNPVTYEIVDSKRTGRVKKLTVSGAFIIQNSSFERLYVSSNGNGSVRKLVNCKMLGVIENTFQSQIYGNLTIESGTYELNNFVLYGNLIINGGYFETVQETLFKLTKDGTENPTITVNDGNTEISFNRVGGSSFLSQFPALFTHMCKILWVINRHSDDPDLNLDLGKIKFKSEDGNEVEFDMSSIKKLIQQNAIPTSSEHFGGDIYVKPFEFMDMINYMFHGTLSDVSTHSLEWKNGKIVGGRDSWTKITGVMYPQGIFVDPRID